MKKSLLLFFCFLLLISCNQSEPLTKESIVKTTITDSTPSSTLTPVATKTLATTPAKIVLVTPTSNFDNLTPQSFTPSPPENCPNSIDGEIDFPQELKMFESSLSDEDIIVGFEDFVISNLNEGKILSLLNILSKENISYYFVDITNDGVNDLIIKYINIIVFSCKNNNYINLKTFSSGFYGSYIVAIRDLNSNNVMDLAILVEACQGCNFVSIYEWNGQDFKTLVLEYSDYYSENKLSTFNTTDFDGYAKISIEDINKDGFYEIVLDGGIPSYIAGVSGDDGPYRAQKVIYMWNGENFVWYSQEYYPPNFKFEAVLDGDTQTLRGLYDKALLSYQSAIFDEKLKSWDEKIWRELLWNREGLAYPDIQKMPFNQKEYDQLSAYSRYRIMILHLIRGWDSDAEIVYKNLIELYPKGTDGYPYVQMATEFWNEYQISRDFYKSCEKAIQYAQENEVILEPFGWHGLFYNSYEIEDICPFTK